jgi:hypothetical protein
MTAGERRLAQRLEDKLEDDYLVWYDVPVGHKRLHPDFILLHPQWGLIILEVKDWKLETLCQVNPQTVTLLTAEGEKTVRNPLEQARGYALELAKMLEQDPLLVEDQQAHRGKVAFPYGYGVVLTHITRRQFDAQVGLCQVFEPHLVICQDEFYEAVDAIAFQERLWNLFPYAFGTPLTPEQIDRIRWHIFPDIRITAKQLTLFSDEHAEDQEVEAEMPDLLQVMDVQQEQLARSMGDGHRIIHGVAGSGKTLILIHRCLNLAEKPDQPILVLCFNVSLAAKLRQMIQEKQLSGRVIVRHFHGWCNDLLRQYRLPKPSPTEFQGVAYIKELVEQVIRSVETGKIPVGSYAAVLIDEGHDFKSDWLKLVAQMVNPQTNALLLLYDDAQSIYGETQQRKVSFKRLGIQAQGRTTILKLNYRNTYETLTVAYEFAKDCLTPSDAQDEDVPLLIQPQSAGRRGSKPELIQLPNFQQEVEYLAHRAQQLHERGTAWNEIAIIYRARWMAERIYKHFQQMKIPVEWVNRDGRSRDYRPAAASIKLVTMHSSKGLEFPVVFIPGIGFMHSQNSSERDEARLLYIAMTRAIHQLVITGDRSSPFVQRLEGAIAKLPSLLV